MNIIKIPASFAVLLQEEIRNATVGFILTQVSFSSFISSNSSVDVLLEAFDNISDNNLALFEIRRRSSFSSF